MVRGRAREAERGETLIEILVAVVILGLAVTAILGLLGVDVAGSAQHRRHAIALTMLTTGAEHVKAEAAAKNVCVDGVSRREFTGEPQSRYDLSFTVHALDGGDCDPTARVFLVQLAVALDGDEVDSLDVVVGRPE